MILIAEHLRGHADAQAMPIDFQQHWRGMLLPLAAAGLFEALSAAGVTDPFILTFILRLITAALAIAVLRDLARAVKPMLRAENRLALDALSWFLWFVPVLLIRFNGEALSGLFFARGLTLLIDEKPRSRWAIGAWWGATVLLRPAAAILPLGAWAWSIAVKRIGSSSAWRILGGGSIAIACGTAIDSIAYGTTTMPLANYLTAAISGEESARFTALPWYQYGLFVVKHASIPIGLLLLASLGALLTLKRSHVLVWVIVPFLIAHAVVPVKEPRFLFPLAPLMPWLLVAAWDALHDRWSRIMRLDLWLRLLFPFAAVNALALVVALATPAGNGRIQLARAIQHRYGAAPVHIEIMGDWRQWIPPFYLAPGSTEAFVERIVPDKQKNSHLIIAHASAGLDDVHGLERMAVATPLWTHRFLRWHGLEDGYDPLVLYRLNMGVIGH